MAKAASDNGTVCSRFIFILAAGIFHFLISKLISSQRVSAASAGRDMVSSCHINKHRVDRLILAVRIVCMSCGNCSGRIFGIYFSLVFQKPCQCWYLVLHQLTQYFEHRSSLRWYADKGDERFLCTSGLNGLYCLNQYMGFDIGNADITYSGKHISFKRTPNIVTVIFGYGGLLHFPPTFSDKLEGIGFSLLRVSYLIFLIFLRGNIFRQ